MSAQRYGTPDVEKGGEESVLIIFIAHGYNCVLKRGRRGERGEGRERIREREGRRGREREGRKEGEGKMEGEF